MMDVKPLAVSAEVDEGIIRDLVDEYGSLSVIRAISQLLREDLKKRVESRDNWLNNACKVISAKRRNAHQ